MAARHSNYTTNGVNHTRGTSPRHRCHYNRILGSFDSKTDQSQANKHLLSVKKTPNVLNDDVIGSLSLGGRPLGTARLHEQSLLFGSGTDNSNAPESGPLISTERSDAI